MSEPRARDVIAGVLGEHRPFWHSGKRALVCESCPEWSGRNSDDANQHRADALIAAGVTVPEPPAIPDRAFVDDYGRRWEWCGGTEGTWAWRITALPEPNSPRCTGRIAESAARVIAEVIDIALGEAPSPEPEDVADDIMGALDDVGLIVVDRAMLTVALDRNLRTSPAAAGADTIRELIR